MYNKLQSQLATTNTTLIAVSKTKSNAAIIELYNQGQRDFGENKVQELVEKYNALPKDIRWHMIGHLQSNKIKQIVPFVHLIHSVDSAKLLDQINKEAEKVNRKVPILLQFYIAKEETKFGLDIAEATIILNEKSAYEFIEFKGVMGMASYVNDTNIIQQEFRSLKNIFQQLKEQYFANDDNFNEISMGMSGDFEMAIEQGSTMVRIGSLLFGSRV
jgi:PLP dependent protein